MNIAFVTWTNTECEDVFPLYFGQFDKYCYDYKSYIAINNTSEKIPDKHIQIINKESDPFYKRLSSCLEQIEEEYIIYMQEDHILYDNPNHTLIQEYNEFLSKTDYSCLRLIKSGEMGGNKLTETLFDVPMTSRFLLSQQTAIWKRKDLIKLLKFYRPKTYRDVEMYGSSACNSLKIKSCYHYDNEDKVGNFHFNSNVFPYIATAINKKKWNMTEYENILSKLLQEYHIDYNLRGIC